jgi:hypothetical protein
VSLNGIRKATVGEMPITEAARSEASWVQIPLEAWISVCVYSVFVLFCVYVAALRQADPPSKESYSLCIGLRN